MLQMSAGDIFSLCPPEASAYVRWRHLLTMPAGGICLYRKFLVDTVANRLSREWSNQSRTPALLGDPR